MKKVEAEYLIERFERVLDFINSGNVHMASACVLSDISALKVISEGLNQDLHIEAFIEDSDMANKIDEFLSIHEADIALGSDSFHLLEPLFIKSQQREPLVDGMPFAEWYRRDYEELKLKSKKGN